MQSNILSSVFFSAQIIFFTVSAQSQPSEPRMSKVDYIETFKDQAIREMHATGIPASITLAQGMLESDYGNSPLAKYAKNHFGIKCHTGWEGPTFIQDDDERNECFRKYYSVDDSYHDHSQFLMTRDRYAFLFDLKPTDYKGWAHGLKKAGYATNPKYAHLLIKIIEENALHQYDDMRKLPEKEMVAAVKPEREEARRQPVAQVRAVTAIDVSENNIKFVLAESGDTPEKIADRYNMGKWQILKYNDLNGGTRLLEGEVIYLQPKRNYAKQDYHTVANGETLRDVSQKYGVKMSKLQKMNGLSEGQSVSTGDKLVLRKVSKVGEMFTGR